MRFDGNVKFDYNTLITKMFIKTLQKDAYLYYKIRFNSISLITALETLMLRMFY